MSSSKNDISQLRPQKLQEYIGQNKIKKTLTLFLDAAIKRGKVTEHILLYGPPGLGKTTLSYIIAKELQGEIKIASGATITKTGDLAAILTNLKENDVLFIDEIHRLPKAVEEVLYPVIEEFFLDIVIGKGPSARTVRLPIPNITIIGATTKLALLSAPLRDRFGLLMRLDYYSDRELLDILKRSASILNIEITDSAAKEIAKRSRRTPRLANRILKRARDLIEVREKSLLDEETVQNLFHMLDIDEEGLSDLDLQYLRLIGEKFENTPVGVETIASSLAEDKRTIEEFIEPYLLRIGFIKKTTRGRVLTQRAVIHLGLTNSPGSAQQSLL